MRTLVSLYIRERIKITFQVNSSQPFNCLPSLTLYAALNNIWILNGKNLQKILSCSNLKDHTEIEISFSGVYFYVLNICGAIHSSFSETT